MEHGDGCFCNRRRFRSNHHATIDTRLRPSISEITALSLELTTLFPCFTTSHDKQNWLSTQSPISEIMKEDFSIVMKYLY